MDYDKVIADYDIIVTNVAKSKLGAQIDFNFIVRH